jgi:hypothetical protein
MTPPPPPHTHTPHTHIHHHHADEHYLHHAISIKNKTLHTGFFLKWWDRAVGSEDTGKCRCTHCERAAGKRTKELWNKLAKPDYTPLLDPQFWMSGEKVV